MYYTNSPKPISCRVRIDTRTSRALGLYEVISRDTLADNFAITPGRIGYLPSFSDNEIVGLGPNGFHEVVAGSKDSKFLMSATGSGQRSNLLTHLLDDRVPVFAALQKGREA